MEAAIAKMSNDLREREQARDEFRQKYNLNEVNPDKPDNDRANNDKTSERQGGAGVLA